MVVGLKGQIKGLDDLIGTDLWVRVRLRNDNGSHSYSFIKVLDAEERTSANGYTTKYYRFLELDIRYLSRAEVYHCTNEDCEYKLKSKGRVLPDYAIKILQPIELAETDDIFKITDR